MFYALLGRLTWWIARFALGRRYGRFLVPKPLMGVIALLAALGGRLVARRMSR